MIHLFDHLLVAVIVALFPLYSWREVRKAERQLAEPDAPSFDTVREYQRTIAMLVVLAALCLANWFFQGRGASTLGLGAGATGLRWAAGAALALLGLGLTGMYAVRVDRDAEARATLRTQFDRFTFLLPQTSRELRWFRGVALTAGLCEETLYRGFLIWYLQHWMGVVPALLASSVAFGLAHSYQGAASIPRAAIIGLWCGGIFLLTGSLWLAMATHFVYDVIAGGMIYGSLRTRTSADETTKV
jgi:membrane protease YdiL (CAAX protease family)